MPFIAARGSWGAYIGCCPGEPPYSLAFRRSAAPPLRRSAAPPLRRSNGLVFGQALNFFITGNRRPNRNPIPEKSKRFRHAAIR